MLELIDIFFIAFHTSLILFNLFGWIFRPVRKWNLITLIITGLSWFGLGIFYGFGYCFLTDWHFNVLRKLGHTDLPSSYLSYLANRLLNISIDAQTVDTLTLLLFFVALSASVLFNALNYFRK